MVVQHMLPIAKYDLGKVRKETRYSKTVYVYARIKNFTVCIILSKIKCIQFCVCRLFFISFEARLSFMLIK